MRQYKVQTEELKALDRIICNQCGKEILIQKGVPQEDYLAVNKRWGYYSKKDNEENQFDICEACYDEWVQGFKIKMEK